MALKEKPPHVDTVRAGDMLVSDGSFQGVAEGERGTAKFNEGGALIWKPLDGGPGVHILADEKGYLIGFTRTPLETY